MRDVVDTAASPHDIADAQRPLTHDQYREQHLSRALINNLFVLLKTAYIHQQNNTALHRPLESIQQTTSALFEHTKSDTITLRPLSNTFFMNDTLIRLDRFSFQNAEFLRIICGEVRIGSFEFYRGCDEPAFRGLMQAIVDAVREGSSSAAFRRDFDTIYLKPPVALSSGKGLRHRRQFILHNYALALMFMSQVLARWSQRKHPPLSRFKRTAQNLLEMLDEDAATLLGLTQLRAYRSHPATHLVHVAILSLAIGQRVGLSRPDLVQLGMTALLHELGLMDVPPELLERLTPLGDAEQHELAKLPLFSVQRLMEFPVVGLEGIARVVSVFENRGHVPTPPTYHARLATDVKAQIMAVADAYDHLITSRLGHVALAPDRALRVLLDNREGTLAAWAVKLLASAIGRYPIGSMVELDTGEHGIVVALPPQGAPADRPPIRLVTASDGTSVEADTVVQLTATDASGRPLRSIRQTLHPDLVPVNVPRFFLD
jgi:HD-GYP domain-containing protein (c-di-GMP phosphodiesterase class II)